jgi:hypothetical protein
MDLGCEFGWGEEWGWERVGDKWPLSLAFDIGLCCFGSFTHLPARIGHFLPSLQIYKGAIAWFGGS